MIKLVAVLAETNQATIDDKPHYFSIQYVKKDGYVGKKHRVRKSGTNPQRGAIKGGGTFAYKVKEKGVLMLHDDLTGNPFTIKISLLTHFNGIRIRH